MICFYADKASHIRSGESTDDTVGVEYPTPCYIIQYTKLENFRFYDYLAMTSFILLSSIVVIIRRNQNRYGTRYDCIGTIWKWGTCNDTIYLLARRYTESKAVQYTRTWYNWGTKRKFFTFFNKFARKDRDVTFISSNKALIR